MDAGPSFRVNILTDKKEYRRGLKDLYHWIILPPLKNKGESNNERRYEQTRIT